MRPIVATARVPSIYLCLLVDLLFANFLPFGVLFSTLFARVLLHTAALQTRREGLSR